MGIKYVGHMQVVIPWVLIIESTVDDRVAVRTAHIESTRAFIEEQYPRVFPVWDERLSFKADPASRARIFPADDMDRSLKGHHCIMAHKLATAVRTRRAARMRRVFFWARLTPLGVSATFATAESAAIRTAAHANTTSPSGTEPHPVCRFRLSNELSVGGAVTLPEGAFCVLSHHLSEGMEALVTVSCGDEPGVRDAARGHRPTEDGRRSLRCSTGGLAPNAAV
jgi:hypothetical protein